MQIKVGIYTAGVPRLKAAGRDNHILENQAIGVGFHWMQCCESTLPGRVTVLPEMTEVTDTDMGLCGISLVNELDLETYLKAVVSSEMNPDAPFEFIKAHAVIARSWALGKIIGIHRNDCKGKVKGKDLVIDWADTESHHGFHVCSDDHCQRYQGTDYITSVVEDAVAETDGMYLADSENLPIDARFSKCCGGRTELFSTCWQDVDYPYLQSIEDPYCDLSGMSERDRDRFLDKVLKDYDRNLGTLHDWEVLTSTLRLRYNLKEMLGIDVGEITDIHPEMRGPSGRIHRMRITSRDGEMTVGKELLIRRLLSTSTLYSSAFEIKKDNELLKLTGKGWGHGVGLCQIGAARMAALGHDFRSILSFYYPGAKLMKPDLNNN